MNPANFRLQYIRRFKNSDSPITGLFELTGRCNLNCKMCYVHTKPNVEFLRTEKDGDWWISQIDDACEKGMLFATLTGGECLLHPDFRKIYLHLREKGVFVQINTNGLLLTQPNVDFLKKNPPFEIQLTLYAVDDAGYEQVTGAAVFHYVEDAIARVKAAGLNIRITITPSAYNPGETERIVKYLKTLQVPYSINEAIVDPYDGTETRGNSNKEIDVNEKIRYLRLEKNLESIPVAEEDLPPVGGGQLEVVRGVKCSAGRVAFAISHDGYMMPCTIMHHLRVRLDSTTDFSAAWKQMLSIGKNFIMPIECEGCAYIKVCLSCPLLRGGKVGGGHCDPAVCDMTRKLVAAGVKKLEQPAENCE